MAPPRGRDKDTAQADTPADKPKTKAPAKPRAAAKPAVAKPAAKAAAKPKAAPRIKTAAKPAPKPRAAKKAVETVPAVATRFNRALDDARTGAEVIGQKAKAKATAYRAELEGRRGELTEEARALAEQAKVRAADLAKDGKARASDALTGLGKMVADNAATVDEHLGARYGDYARSAARGLQEAAVKLDSKDVAELGEDARKLARNNPGLAIGLAAVVGFVLARLFSFAND